MISDYENIVWYSFCVSGKHKQNHRTIFQVNKCTIQTIQNKQMSYNENKILEIFHY